MLLSDTPHHVKDQWISLPSDYTFYGGPMDGATVDWSLTRQELIVIANGTSKNNGVVYYYIRCDDHKQFEYQGDDLEGEDFE